MVVSGYLYQELQDGSFVGRISLLAWFFGRGFVLKGVDEYDFSGNSVSGAGDINGDGIDDLIIGARNAYPNGKFLAGESYVVFGRTSGFPAAFELESLLP